MEIIQAEHIELGKNVIISPTAIIRGLTGKAKHIKIGDNTYIGDHVQIIVSFGCFSLKPEVIANYN